MSCKASTEPEEEKETSTASGEQTGLLLHIESVAYGGAGVGRSEGMVFFVPFTFPGEQVRVEVVRRQKRFCEARLLSIEVASPLRLAPRCKYFEKCGGCSYQHVPYALQLEWKADQVRELLQRVGRIERPPVQHTVPSPSQWAYRNRIRVHADGKRVGFYPKFGRDLVDIAACPIACEAVNGALDTLRKTYPTPGEYPLSARSDVRFFEQTNDGAAAELLRVVDEAVGDNNAALVDAYSGAGFFGRRLAPRFGQVIGIETHEGAVAAARKRAGPKERYLCGDVATHLGGVLEALPRDRTVVLLDPPAAGVAARVTDLLTALSVARVVYVSCDPATLARDLGALARGGYRISTVTPLDMFPQTADVEVVAVLEPLAPQSARNS
ncbi:MAG: hypothetical protein WCL08_02785 [Verrucomicrobiota bacterium]